MVQTWHILARNLACICNAFRVFRLGDFYHLSTFTVWSCVHVFVYMYTVVPVLLLPIRITVKSGSRWHLNALCMMRSLVPDYGVRGHDLSAKDHSMCNIMKAHVPTMLDQSSICTCVLGVNLVWYKSVQFSCSVVQCKTTI
jgi:hypothetical protein